MIGVGLEPLAGAAAAAAVFVVLVVVVVVFPGTRFVAVDRLEGADTALARADADPMGFFAADEAVTVVVAEAGRAEEDKGALVVGVVYKCGE